MIYLVERMYNDHAGGGGGGICSWTSTFSVTGAMVSSLGGFLAPNGGFAERILLVGSTDPSSSSFQITMEPTGPVVCESFYLRKINDAARNGIGIQIRDGGNFNIGSVLIPNLALNDFQVYQVTSHISYSGPVPALHVRLDRHTMPNRSDSSWWLVDWLRVGISFGDEKSSAQRTLRLRIYPTSLTSLNSSHIATMSVESGSGFMIYGAQALSYDRNPLPPFSVESSNGSLSRNYVALNLVGRAAPTKDVASKIRTATGGLFVQRTGFTTRHRLEAENLTRAEVEAVNSWWMAQTPLSIVGHDPFVTVSSGGGITIGSGYIAGVEFERGFTGAPYEDDYSITIDLETF